MSADTNSIDFINSEILQVNRQIADITAYPVPPHTAGEIARKLAVLNAYVADLIASQPALTVPDSSADLITVRKASDGTFYVVPVSAAGSSVFGGSRGMFPNLAVPNFGGFLGVEAYGAKVEVASLGANIMTLYPFFVPRPMKLQVGWAALAAPIKTISGGGTRFSLAVFDSLTARNPYPKSMVSHVNGLAAYNVNWQSSGIQESADVLLDAQRVYYFALNSEGGDETYSGYVAENTWQIGGTDMLGAGDAGPELNGYRLVRAWNDWSDFPAAQSLVKIAAIPDIRARLLQQ